MKNQSFGKWSEEQTNWNDKDTVFVENILKEKTLPTSHEELLDEYEKSIMR